MPWHLILAGYSALGKEEKGRKEEMKDERRRMVAWVDNYSKDIDQVGVTRQC